MRALNFYSSDYQSQLICRRKNCTIRLGDKTNKYQEGDIVWVTIGKRFSQKKKIFIAVIDRILIKSISRLTLNDLQGEKPDITNIEDVIIFLETIYQKKLLPTDIVSILYFSEILE